MLQESRDQTPVQPWDSILFVTNPRVLFAAHFLHKHSSSVPRMRGGDSFVPNKTPAGTGSARKGGGDSIPEVVKTKPGPCLSSSLLGPDYQRHFQGVKEPKAFPGCEATPSQANIA